MRRPLAMLAIAVPLVACGSSSGARHASGPGVPTAPSSVQPCGPPGARAVAADPIALVYAHNGLVYGCSAGDRRSFKLGELRPCLSVPCVGQVRLAGRTVAYASIRHGVDTSSSEVIVRRLSSGKILVRDPATRGPLGPESFTSVEALVVRRDGAVAWIGREHSIVRRGTEIEVIEHDRHGLRILDSSTAIAARSLRLSGSKLTWRDGSVTRSATLD